ncbi:hypothetical protein [uncultured Thalassospira sp.]|uniref:hypothetical protein n=1 Tax=uncultured Thalassospira sp. TaxID=404382 RepID=UPI00258AB7E4|nr:hypothetical protein [uncultured Thalassospira sp.]
MPDERSLRAAVAVLDLQLKIAPLERFLNSFSLQVMSTGSERGKIKGSKTVPAGNKKSGPIRDRLFYWLRGQD